MLNISKIKQNKPLKELMTFGIFNIDKPAGCTSFDVVEKVKKMLNLAKCGHFGTLDPMVTGVLPICLGNACKIQEYFMHRDKTYIGTMKLHQDITREKLEEAMQKFIGVINQLPPRISRVKRVVRKREIMEFKITKFNVKKKEAEFITKVEAGTYIRKLIDDLGKNLGIGAQMIALRRTQAGLFSDNDKEFCTIEELEKAFKEYETGKEEKLRKLIVPAEIIIELIPAIDLKEDCLERLKHGSPIFKNMMPSKEENSIMKTINSKKPFAVLCSGRLVEIAKWSDHFENKEIVAKPEGVLI